MRKILPENLIKLADACPAPLYVVGGSVRDFLSGAPFPERPDWDLCSPAREEDLISAAEACGFAVRAVYPHTGTVKLQDGRGQEYEFTRFRSDKYVRGIHTPAEIEFTDDIVCDARRRDFCANAVYYDVKAGVFADPLGGMADIAAKRLRTVREAERVFGEDGLRLMRLARISAQTGFAPDRECLEGAAKWSALIRDIAPERIFAELRALLHADGKQNDRDAPYRGLCILRGTGVLKEILPELALGEGMMQNERFHAHDVVEHSFRCVRYSVPGIRFAALLHDVGKPFCKLRDGNFHAHAEESARIAREFLQRLRAPSKLTDETVFLVKEHMYDLDLQTGEYKVRRKLIACGDRLPLLLALKQADFSACKDDLRTAPAVVKWEGILQRMKAEGVPFSPRELALSARDVQSLGVPAPKTAEALAFLMDFCIGDGGRNRRNTLEAHLKKFVF